MLDLDAGDFLEGLGQRLRFILVHRQGFGDGVDLHPLEGSGGLDEPLHFLHLVVLGQRRRLELAVDPFFGGSFVRTRRRCDRSRGCHQRDRACHHQDAGPGLGPVTSLKVSHVVSSVAATNILRPGLTPDLLFFASQTVRKIATAETSEITVASHRLDNSIPSPTGIVTIVSVPTNPIHTRWITAAMINEMNNRSPRVVGMRRIPTRSASG